MKKYVFIISILLSLISKTAFAVSYIQPTDKEINQARESFKYKDQWIHPKIVEEFLPLASDYTLPLVTSVDVGAATGTNRFFGDVEEKKDVISYKNSDGDIVSYSWKGRLRNGMHVLVVRRAGSGTMVSTDLVIFDLVKRHSVDSNGKKYPQLSMEVKRLYNLGDRAAVKTTLVGNNVEVETECEKTCDPKKIKITL